MDGVTSDEQRVKQAWESSALFDTNKADNRVQDYSEIRDLIQASLATGDISKSWYIFLTSPLTVDELKQLYARIQDDVKYKERQLQKINGIQVNRGQDAGYRTKTESRNRSQDSEVSSVGNRNRSQDKKFNRLRGDLAQIADRLKAAEDLEV